MWIDVIKFLGSVALFLFGFRLLGEGMESVVSGKIREALQKLTGNRLIAFLTGFVLTMLLQFSAATVILTVGMVNSGIIGLIEAGGLILGANLATTIKTQLFFLQPGLVMPVALIIGTWLYVFSKEKKKRDFAYIFLGLGILLAGLDYLRITSASLSSQVNFELLLGALGNSWLAALVAGILITVMVQSSSGAMAIFITLASSGTIGLDLAVPLVMGANIGTTSTALISAISARRDGQRAALMHFLFNLLGVLILWPAASVLTELAIRFSNGTIAMQYANLHFLFNLFMCAVMLPLIQLVVKISDHLVPGRASSAELTTSTLLDSRMVTSPAMAEEQVKQLSLRMGDLARNNVRMAVDGFMTLDVSSRDKLKENEEFINYLEVQIASFLVKLAATEMSEQDYNQTMATHYLIADIEKIGDLADSIMDLAVAQADKGEGISTGARDELRSLYNYIIEAVNVALDSYRYRDKNLASTIFDLEKHIITMEAEYRANHIKRLNRGICTAGAGILYLDVLSSLVRITKHCVNIAEIVLRAGRV